MNPSPLAIYVSGFGHYKHGYCSYCYSLAIREAWNSIKDQTENKAARGVCEHWRK